MTLWKPNDINSALFASRSDIRYVESCIYLLYRWVYDSGKNMEEDVLERLRTVFNVCDERNEGYISTEHFKELAKEHFGQAGDDEVSFNVWISLN